MSEDKYDALFKQVEDFKKEQSRQKLRGINDYNMVNVVRNEYREVGMHSNVIYSLLDPDGLHYQDDLFLNLFITNVLGFKTVEEFGRDIQVEAEELTKENRRIDFTIKSDKYCVGIEMKINAGDSENQLYDYYDDLIKKAEENKKLQNVIIYYLTKDGSEASEYSLGKSKNDKDKEKYEALKKSYECISFKKHILNWIKNCQKEVANITNLNQALENYKDIVLKITNDYKGKLMQINKILKDNFEISYEVFENLPIVSAELEIAFWTTLVSKINQIEGFIGFNIGHLNNKDEQKFDKTLSIKDVAKAITHNVPIKSEVHLVFKLFDDVRFLVGVDNGCSGIRAVVYKKDWKNMTDDDDNLIGKFNEISGYGFSSKRWCYASGMLNKDVNLRNQNLIYASRHIKKIAQDIDALIKTLKGVAQA